MNTPIRQPGAGAKSASRCALCAGIALALLISAAPSAMARTVKGVKVTDQIFMATDMSRTYLVVTPEGNVVIDTTTRDSAPRHYEVLRGMSSAPVKYILLTHAHEDHVGGVHLWKEEGTEVIAQRRFVEYMHYRERLAGFFQYRNEAQFLAPPRDVKSKGNFAADIPTTMLFDSEYKFEFGGLTFHMMHTPGETWDHSTVWIPELKAAFIGDNYYSSFPNIAALRGAPPRFALDYVNSIDIVLALDPELVLVAHAPPLVGKEKIQSTLGEYRDAIEYVHDATVRGLNEGKDVFTVMNEVKLPERFEINESYGGVAWSVRGIYHGYAGWFDGQPATLLSESPDVKIRELVELAGGVDEVVARAEALEEEGDLVLSLNMADAALAADPNHPGALAVRVSLLTTLGRGEKNFNARSWIGYHKRLSQKRLEAQQAVTTTSGE